MSSESESKQVPFLHGSIRNLCIQPVYIETGDNNIICFSHKGRTSLDLRSAGSVIKPESAEAESAETGPVGYIDNHIDKCVPLYRPSNGAEINTAEITKATYIDEFPLQSKAGLATFYIVPRSFLCFALNRHYAYTSRLLVIELLPKNDKVWIHNPQAPPQPSGRLISAMSYQVPPEYRHWLIDKDKSIVLG